MTFLQAIDAIERKVEKCGLKYYDKTPMEPIVALGKIGKWHGARYDHVIDSLWNGLITVDDYFMEMIKMVHDYQTRERNFEDGI